MADQTKKIIFEAQDNGVSTAMDRMRRNAEQTAGDLIRSARQYSTSGAQVLKYLEEEIRLVEKRDKLNARVRQAELDTSYRARMEKTPEWMQPGVTTRYKAESIRIGEEARLESVQVELLRELIDTVKQTAREEIREDRKSVEDKLARDKSVGALGIAEKADAIDELKKTLQYQEVGGIKEDEQSERSRFKFGAAAGRGFNAAAGVAIQPNEFFMAAALLAMIPIVGAGLSGIASKAFSSAQGYETALGNLGALRGGGIEGNLGAGVGYAASLGLTPSQATNRAIAFARARGGVGPGDMFMRDMELNTQYMRGWGMSESDLLQNARLARGGTFEGGVVPGILANALGGRGVIKGNDLSTLPEYLQVLNQLGQQQIEVLGSIDQGINSNLISAIASMGGMFGNPDMLKRVMSSFQSGLSRPVNPGVRALQLYTLQRSAYNDPYGTGGPMSLLDLEIEQEKGLGAMGGAYLPEFLKTLKGRSGGNKDMFVRNIAGSFGLSLTVAKQVAEGFDSGKLSTEQMQGLIKDGSSKSGDISRSLQQRAEANVGQLEKSTATISSFFEMSGEKLIQSLSGINEKLDKWLEKITENMAQGPGEEREERIKERKEKAKENTKQVRELQSYAYKDGIY